MAEIINQFSNGMQNDWEKNNQPENSYNYGENIRLQGENAQNISIENVKGNVRLVNFLQCETRYKDPNVPIEKETIPVPYALDGEEYKAIGITTVKDFAIILVSNGKVGYILFHKPIPNTIGQHKFYSMIPHNNTIWSDYSFNPIGIHLGYDVEYHDTYAELRSDNKIYYYIAGKNNKPSRAIIFDSKCAQCQCSDCDEPLFPYFLDSNYNYDNFDSLTRIIPYSKDPIIHLKGFNQTPQHLAGVKNGGNVESGNWKYSIRYIDAFGNKTNWSPISGEVPVYDEALQDDRNQNWNRIYGTQPQRKCRKSVLLEIHRVDTNFTEVELAGIHNSDGIESAYIIKTAFINKNSSILEIEHNGYEPYIPINIEEIVLNKANIFNFETLKSLDNYLFIASIKETLLKNYLPLQKIADEIKLTWEIYTIPESEGTFNDKVLTINTSPTQTELIDSRPKVGNYKIPFNTFYKLGYFRDDHYSFGIQFKLTDGTRTPVFPIGKADLNTIVQGFQENDNVVNSDNCSASLGNDNYWHQVPTQENLIYKPDNIKDEDYDINIDFCALVKNFSYYKEGAYIYKSPPHISGYEIIDGDPFPLTEQVNLQNLNTGLTAGLSGAELYETRKLFTNMGRPRYVRVLHPVFHNIQIPDSLNIEGFYILRCDRNEFGKIKSTGILCPSSCDAADPVNAPDCYTKRPATPVFLNWSSAAPEGSPPNHGHSNSFKAGGQLSTKWAPVVGYWSWDEIYAKEEYIVSNDDILEVVYTNAPVHAGQTNSCGFPVVDQTVYGGFPPTIGYIPTTEQNLNIMYGCNNVAYYGDVGFNTSVPIFPPDWFVSLFLNFWTSFCGQWNDPIYIGNGSHEACSSGMMLHAEVNLWQRIQTRRLDRGYYPIISAVNYATYDKYYPIKTQDGLFNLYYGSPNPTITIDMANTTIAVRGDGDCSPGTERPRFLFQMHPCKLLNIAGIGFMPYVTRGTGNHNGNPNDNYAVHLSGYGLLMYGIIRKRESRYPAPIYRDYYYASHFIPTKDEGITYSTISSYNNGVENVTVHNNLNVFGGDCYIGKYYLNIQRRVGSSSADSLSNNTQNVWAPARSRPTFISCYGESKHNIGLYHVVKNEDGAVLDFGSYPYFTNEITIDREIAEVWAGTEYQLGYTTKKDNFSQFVKDFTDSEEITLYQIRYSLKHLDVNKEDQYRIFLINNYKDATRRYGQIVKLEGFSENLIMFQYDGVGFYRVSQQAQVPTSAGEVQLATAGVLTEKPEYVTTDFEAGLQDLLSVRNIDIGLLFFDKKRKKINLFDGQRVTNLSEAKGIKSIVTALNYEQDVKKLPVFIAYDRNMQEVLIKKLHTNQYIETDVAFAEELLEKYPQLNAKEIPEILVWSNRLNTFVSYYTCNPDIAYSIGNRFFSMGKSFKQTVVNGKLVNEIILTEHNIGERGTFYEKKKNSKISFVVNPKSNVTFNGLKIIGNCDFIPKQYRMFKDRIEVYPKSLEVKTSYQYNIKQFINKINVRDIYFAQKQGMPIDNILYKEQVWHTDFPFALSGEQLQVALENNLQQEIWSVERFRDQYAQLVLEMDNAEGYDPNSEEYFIFNNKRYRWVYVISLVSPSFI